MRNERFAIGIDIGGSSIKIGTVSESGNVSKKFKITNKGESSINELIKVLDTLISSYIIGIGIGIAGLINKESGKILNSPNISFIETINIVDILSERFNLQVFIENDANAAAIGEMWVGAGRDFPNFVLLTLGTGIGGGIIYKKKLLEIPAEIGHMSINSDGYKCTCGNMGCLEAYASANAILSNAINNLEKGRESILKSLHNGNYYKLTVEDIYKSALEGDNLAREILKEAGRYLGIGIANIINIFGPDAVILTGGLTGAWDIYVNEAIKEASRRAFKDLYNKAKIIPSILKDDAGVIGSAYLVLNH
jgi:glucokinase